MKTTFFVSATTPRLVTLDANSLFFFVMRGTFGYNTSCQIKILSVSTRAAYHGYEACEEAEENTITSW